MTDPFRDALYCLFTGTWPPVTQQTAVAAWVASLAVIAGLYAWKAFFLNAVTRPRDAALLFACLIGFCVPVTWTVSPAWERRHVLRPATYIGEPVMTLTIPNLSFAYDLIRKANGTPLELVVSRAVRDVDRGTGVGVRLDNGRVTGPWMDQDLKMDGPDGPEPLQRDHRADLDHLAPAERPPGGTPARRTRRGPCPSPAR